MFINFLIFINFVSISAGKTKFSMAHLGLKQQKLCVGFLLTNRQFREVGHCRRHISGFLVAKFYVEFENATFSCDNLRPFDN